MINVVNVTDMSLMFSECSSLTSLDLSNFNTSNVEDFNTMFYNCSSLTSLNLSNWNTNRVTDMSNMFQDCSSLTTLDLSSFDISNVGNIGNMFYNCSSLQTLTLGPKFVFKEGIIGNDVFYDCTKLTRVIIGKNRSDFANIFKALLPNPDKWEYNSELGYLSINPYTKSDPVHLTSEYYTLNEQTGIATILIDNIIRDGTLTSCEDSFNGKTSLKQITNITSLDTSQVTTMAGMFSGCSSLGLPV